jgi:hypothetical protein
MLIIMGLHTLDSLSLSLSLSHNSQILQKHLKMGMQFMIGFVQQKKSTFYFSIDCNTLDQKHVATMFIVFQEAKLVTMMDGCSIFGYLCLDTPSRKTPNL